MNETKRRDPRVDPKAGDVVIFGPQWQSERYQVLQLLEGGRVHYLMGNVFRSSLNCSLFDWRDWAKNAEVIHCAE